MKYFCKVRATGEIYEAYKSVLVDTLAREKRLSTSAAEAVLDSMIDGERLELNHKTCWKEKK